MTAKNDLLKLFVSRTGKTTYTPAKPRETAQQWQGSRVQEYAFTEDA